MKPMIWWTDEQRKFAETVDAFSKKWATYEEHTRWTREAPVKIYEAVGKEGFMGAAIPKEYGGLGLGCTGSCILADHIHGWMPGIGRIVVGNMNGGLMQIIDHGTEDQKKRFLPEIASGEVGAVVITETTAGTDAAGIRVEAKLVGDEYILNGKKRFIVGAGIANRYFVYAQTSTDPEMIKKHKHLTCFMLHRGAKGFTTERINEILGFENVQNGSLDFKDVHIPVADRIGEEGEGFKIMMGGLNFERTNIAAATIGWNRLLLRNVAPYTQRRVQFGKPTSDIPANNDKVANIIMRLIAIRDSVYYTAHAWDNGEDVTVEASAIKCSGAEMTLLSANDATQAMGGDGVNRFYPVQNIYEVAKTEHVAGGTVEACRLTIYSQAMKRWKEDIQMTRRVIDEELGVPVPVNEPVAKKEACNAENVLKVLAEDYRPNPGLHMAIEDIQWYIDGSAEDIVKVLEELEKAGDVWTYRKKGAIQLARASYAGLNKAFPQEHYLYFPEFIGADRKF